MKSKLLLVLTALSTICTWAQIPTTGLIKDYKFTNGALTSDVIPALQAGTTTLVPTGSARTLVTDRNNEADKAIALNGDSFTAGGTNAATVNNYSISFWVKTTTNETTKRYILNQHNTDTNPAGFSVALKDGKIYFNGQSCWISTSVSGNSGVRQVISPLINDGQWHHIVCSLSSTSNSSYVGSFTNYYATYTYTMYVDNVSVPGDSVSVNFALLTSQSHIVRSITPTNQLVIGKSPDVAYLDYQDSIDQIRYYERTLNASEVDQLYNEDKPKTKIYVNATATGANNGTSWANAYTSLESAITAFTSANEIWVAAGTYKPTGTARTSTFSMKNAIKMYGGFNGTETELSQRNPKNNITILSGDVNGNDNATITATETTRQDNLYHVLTARANVKDVVIDGFTISGGNANGPTLTTGAASAQYYHTRGGAIYINPYTSGDNVTVYITNCILEKNSATDTGVAAGYYAGGVSNQSFRLEFDSCIVRNNFSGTNSQILIAGATGYGWGATSIIKNSLFHNNTSSSGASCLYLSASTANSGTVLGINVSVINCTFSNNSGVNGNVIRTDNGANTYVKNSILYGNGSSTPINYTGLGGPGLTNTISEGGQISGINSNPLLNANFTLQSGSPAIDAGNNGLLVSGMSLDLNGNTRIVGTNVDLGAYEYDANLANPNFDSFSDFTVYPNPAKSTVTIQSPETILKVTLYSIQGREMFTTNESQIDISDLSNGIYFLTVATTKGNGTKKIIKN